MQELIALARADKSFAAFGSPGNGSLSHCVGISMGLATGVELTPVPYKDSACRRWTWPAAGCRC